MSGGPSNQFELLIKRTSKTILDKYPEINEEVGHKIHSSK